MWWLAVMAWAGGETAHRVHGITVSTPTYGPEWGSDAMASTLDVLVANGADWVAIHPYARVGRDGSVGAPFDPENPPDWLTRPIREAHARGLKVMVKPHLAYWGSGFSWRGEVEFEGAALTRFFREYTAFISAVARITHRADAFVVGTELDRLVEHEGYWRSLIATVRGVHPGHLTYAANWDQAERVPFWDALDAVGVQAYYPLVSTTEPPTDAQLDAGWERVFGGLRVLSAKTGKPVVFTELGYDSGLNAAREPWASGSGHPELQERLLRRALLRVEAEPSVRGAFLWKWFPGEAAHGDFRLSEPRLQAVIREVWRK